MWIGSEQLAVAEIVRALDFIASSAIHGASPHSYNTRFYASLGATKALEPFLDKIKNLPGGIPWMPSTSEAQRFAYSYLICCGQLVHIYRLASLERFGLSKSHANGKNYTIELSPAGLEYGQRAALKVATSRKPYNIASGEIRKREKRKQKRKMSAYVGIADSWFIRYDNDHEIVSTYRKKAEDYASIFLEGEALPDDSMIGDRTFKDWKTICIHALGRILCHIDFAKILTEIHPHIKYENVGTIYVRKDDLANVWIQSGLPIDLVDSTIEALTVTSSSLESWAKDFETPCPFYIEYSRDFVLLPSFGALANPYYAMFRHLRLKHTKDWDRAVDKREELFRTDLLKVFPSSKYIIPRNGFKIKREDGSTMTDLDAVIIDKNTGDLALVQLKWHDIYGRSISQRESRKKNILSANTWVDIVANWSSNQNSSEISKRLGIAVHKKSDAPPKIFVVARYAARFSGESPQDVRATWIGWYEILAHSKMIPLKNRLSTLPAMAQKLDNIFQGLPSFNDSFHCSDISIKITTTPGS